MKNQVITILGCTASGKGELARALATQLRGEILSVDSMKIYRGMDIGTAKPSAAARAAIPHHLIDVADPWESFSAARFVELADAAAADIHARGRPVVAVGGTVMYFKFFYEGMFAGPDADLSLRARIRARAATEGVQAVHADLSAVDPVAAARIHRNDLRRIERAIEVFEKTGSPISALQKQWDAQRLRRPEWRWILVGLRRERDAANRRINERVRRMFAAGLLDEARRIWSDAHSVSPQARQAVGYAELFDFFERGEPGATMDDVIERIKINSRHLAKHQRTWLKRIPGVHWLDVTDDTNVDALASAALGLWAS